MGIFWFFFFFFCIYLRSRSADCAFLCLGYIICCSGIFKRGGGELAGTSTYRAVFFSLSFSQIQDTTNERTNDDVILCVCLEPIPTCLARAKTPEPKPVQRCKLSDTA